MIIFYIIIFILIILLIINYYFKQSKQFYNYKTVYPSLQQLKNNRTQIINEINENVPNDWDDWPEYYLYSKYSKWNVYPLYGFGVWVNKNIKNCPTLYSILKKIKGLKTASFSKLGPFTQLKKHQGWADLSNYVLRIHYGIDVPDKCFIGVENNKKQIKNNDIIVFDDSKIHWAENNSRKNRIVLILDIKRPFYIKKGISKIKNTNELNKYIDSFKQLNN